MPVQWALHPMAGHSWHRVAPYKKNREPSKKEKENKTPSTTKKPACPGHACYSRGSRQWEIQGQALQANKPRTVRRRRC